MERPSKKNIALIVFGLLIIGCAIVAYITNPPRPSSEEGVPVSDLKGQSTHSVPIDGSFWTGAEEPKVTIVEFADFECPYCKESYSTIRQLGVKYKDSVKIVFKDYPVHDNSVSLAVAARCAGEQGLFWAMHDKLFAYQGKFALSDLPSIAAEIGVDRDSYAACLSAEKYQAQVYQDLSLGQSLGVSGTPTFFINGYMVKGDKPIEYWEQLIDLIINKNK